MFGSGMLLLCAVLLWTFTTLQTYHHSPFSVKTAPLCDFVSEMWLAEAQSYLLQGGCSEAAEISISQNLGGVEC